MDRRYARSLQLDRCRLSSVLSIVSFDIPLRAALSISPSPRLYVYLFTVIEQLVK